MFKDRLVTDKDNRSKFTQLMKKLRFVGDAKLVDPEYDDGVIDIYTRRRIRRNRRRNKS